MYKTNKTAGYAILLAVALGFAACLYGAYKVDQSRGITVSQSLAMWGL